MKKRINLFSILSYPIKKIENPLLFRIYISEYLIEGWYSCPACR